MVDENDRVLYGYVVSHRKGPGKPREERGDSPGTKEPRHAWLEKSA